MKRRRVHLEPRADWKTLKVGVRVKYNRRYLDANDLDVLRYATGTVVGQSHIMADGEVIWEIAWDGEPEYVTKDPAHKLRRVRR
jgi:hypothetical protein